MIAALPMYDWPEEREAVDALWRAIAEALRARGIAAPQGLTRGRNLWEIWEDGRLLLAQTCGLPYRQRLHGRVGLVGVFDHALPGTPPGHYYSVMVARADDPRERLAEFASATLAFNGFDSQSGWVAAHEVASAAGIRFRRFHHSGAHRASATAVAEREADIAAIDVVTWRLVERHLPQVAARLRVIARSAPTPALPLITAPGRPVEPISQAVAEAVERLEPGLGERLSIAGFTRLPASAWLAVPTPPLPSQAEAAA
ncbi:ABC transporter, phosphonate, substrate-binding protein [Meinhardsimonia xiamenensis]|jgi:hypothetical protein|uniref:ABC transporter, phosphonate, substrate-binding protein n=1 Tax=Meinhardsimonia xiamenensis TaxID=990712 RepID=A0A1G9B0E6_9RHOB|nr:PhnD/SsuA/transferrin family substrate-binding protein [Meinhardsimonia xiamenensis]PRX35173.1 phosphonate ABC transporter substrate-binding protein [Meinhardsimonia xiamenensis]SDK33056.1 ABC transporter, phosphonate, substrate-binding protein [Meinhardsimonia xiamenensis]